MVKICNEPYPTDSKYNSYFESYPYTLSDFQKYAIESIVTGNHVLVTAHTGSGKTLPAEFAIQHFIQNKKKVIYTSPIKALSNQKYYEFTRKYPDISFGLFTGDIKTNPEADVLIMTTEILMNYLFTSLNSTNDNIDSSLQFQIDIQNDLGCVVFDEVHYINDADRGQTWEKTILMLPLHIQMVMLSATIDNPEGFAQWCEKDQLQKGGKEVYLASTSHRVVPLTHYGFMTTTESVYKTIKDKVVQQEIRDTTNKTILLQDAHGKFNETGYKQIVKVNGLFQNNRIRINRKHYLNQLSKFLCEKEMLPAIAFVFSRKNVELCAKEITVPLLEFDSKVGYTVRNECEQIIRRLPNYREYLELPEYNSLVGLLEKGIGIHHSGMIPILREIVELMISKRYIKLLFATESFAIGLDCPIKTAIFTSVTKFDGHTERHLMAHEYTQMAGRAGRRGIDTIGNVIHCSNLFNLPMLHDYKTILGGKPQQLVSKYHISYSLLLNLIKNGQTHDFHDFSKKSMIQREIDSSIKGQLLEINTLQNELEQKTASLQYLKTPVDICKQYIDTQIILKNSTNKKRKEAERKIRNIEDLHRNVKQDIRSVSCIDNLNETLLDKQSTAEYTHAYIEQQTKLICDIMKQEQFIADEIVDNTNHYTFTDMGTIASNIAEIHPLITAKLITQWNYFVDFTPKQLVGLFSCFTDVKVQIDSKLNFPSCDDSFVETKIKDMISYYDKYAEIECEQQLNTGFDYDGAIIFDMADFAMKWCDCNNEVACKMFIQNEVAEKNISIGDFTKAMLKIVTITNELIVVSNVIQNVEMTHTLKQIEPLVLKYITTCQSLYV